MKELRTIFRIKHGSHLYGTSTPRSDLDFKAVHLPPAMDILWQRANNAIAKGPEKAAGEKNQAGDIDEQSFSVHKLFQMLMAGDIIGCEMIFAPESCIMFKDPIYDLVLDNKDLFLSRKVDGYIGYCQRQAAKYGIRGSRIAALREVIKIIDRLIFVYGPNSRVGTFEERWYTFCSKTEHTQLIGVIQKATGRALMHLEVCNRKVPYTVTLKEARDVYQRGLDDYGERALQAEKNEGIDWKAMSHAVRVGNQAIELLNTGKITFPRPEAEYLLDIKLGKVDYKQVAAELEELLEKAVAASQNSVLPETPNVAKIEELLAHIYLKQLL